MSESKWKVIGASGFVGSSIVARLNAEGISVDPIEAPRLATRALDSRTIIEEAQLLEGIIERMRLPGLRLLLTQQVLLPPICKTYLR